MALATITKTVTSTALLVGCLICLRAASASAAGARCAEDCLRGFTQKYLEALAKGDASRLPLSPTVKVTENGQAIAPGEGLLKASAALGTYRFFIEDASTAQAGFIGTLVQDGAPAILWLRLRIERSKITELETIVARKGSHPLFATEAFAAIHPLFQEQIPTAARETRERLIAIANSYFDGIEAHDSKVVLADPACDRIENGVQTTHRPDKPESRGCAASADTLTHIKSVDHRRFPIVDRKRGVVMAVFTFAIPGDAAAPSPTNAARAAQPQAPPHKPRTLLLVELFKIAGGKIQRIEAVMHNLPYGSLPGWP